MEFDVDDALSLSAGTAIGKVLNEEIAELRDSIRDEIHALEERMTEHVDERIAGVVEQITMLERRLNARLAKR